MLLPDIQLSEKYRNFKIPGWPKYYFRVHRLVGYLLMFFFVTGLAGLTGHAGP